MQIKKIYQPLGFLMVVSTLTMLSCTRQQQLKPGPWHAEIIPDTTQPELILPFNMEIKRGDGNSVIAKIHNAGETISVTEIAETKDSVIFHLPVFEGLIKAARQKKRLTGTYTHKAAGRSWTVPFEAFWGENERFIFPDESPLFDPSGKWKVEVNPGSSNIETQVGEFVADGNYLSGTFLTTTGDYRYLEGKVSGDKFMLSAFDGAHAMLFTAKLSKQGTLEDGVFCGGPGWKGSWRAEKDPDASLPDASQLTFLKPGYKKIDFSFPDLSGKPVSPGDDKFTDKALIIQLIGSWCPNSMDESRYFADLYRKYKAKGLEIIALCYESDDIQASRKAIMRFKSDINATYTFLYAGESDKRKASETLPMINRVISYPTSFFIDRQGKIRKIFTGFSGPGTGKYFDNLSHEMTNLIEAML